MAGSNGNQQRKLRSGDLVKVVRTDKGPSSGTDGREPKEIKVNRDGAILQQRLENRLIGETVRIDGKLTPRGTNEIMCFQITELVRPAP